jgi:hypothetical protein
MNAKLEATRIQQPPTQSSRLRVAAAAGELTADMALVITAAEPAINPDSLPMGASVVPDKSGTTFRVWAPSAQRVYLVLNRDGPPMHGLPCSAGITIPANGIVVFGRDLGDR